VVDTSLGLVDASLVALNSRVDVVDISLGLVDASLVALETTVNNMSRPTFSFIVEHQGNFDKDKFIGSFGQSSNSNGSFGLPLPCKMTLIGYNLSLDGSGNNLPEYFTLELKDNSTGGASNNYLNINVTIRPPAISYSEKKTNPEQNGNSVSFKDQLIFKMISISNYSNLMMRLTLLFRSDIDLPS